MIQNHVGAVVFSTVIPMIHLLKTNGPCVSSATDGFTIHVVGVLVVSDRLYVICAFRCQHRSVLLHDGAAAVLTFLGFLNFLN